MNDYYLIEAEPVHDSVTFLLDRLPPGLRLVRASRVDPPLPLARRRAGRQLAELRAADLCFTLEETAAFLSGATGLDLPPLLVATLQDLPRGWAAGMQRAALSLQRHSDLAGFVATFAAAIVMCWITHRRRCWPASPRRSSGSYWKHRCAGAAMWPAVRRGDRPDR